MSNFHQLEVSGSREETQLQVGEKLKYLKRRFQGYYGIGEKYHVL